MLLNKKICIALLPVVIICGLPFMTSAAARSEKTLKAQHFETTSSIAAAICYSKTSQVKYETEYSNALFVECYIKNGEYVEADTPIAKIEGVVSKADIREQELKLKRINEDISEIEVKKAEALRKAQEELEFINTMNSEGLTHIAELKIQSITLDYDMQIKRQKDSIRNINKKLNEMYATRDTEYIYAPVAGIIDNLQYFRENDELYDGTYICNVNEIDDIVYEVNNSTGLLRYGMNVEMKDKQGNVYLGKVISSSAPILANSVNLSKAYIKLDEEIKEYPEKMEATFRVVSVDNAIVLGEEEYETDDNGCYVVEKTSLGGIKHYFTPGRKISGSVVVIDGLEEGMTIVIR